MTDKLEDKALPPKDFQKRKKPSDRYLMKFDKTK